MLGSRTRRDLTIWKGTQTKKRTLTGPPRPKRIGPRFVSRVCHPEERSDEGSGPWWLSRAWVQIPRSARDDSLAREDQTQFTRSNNHACIAGLPATNAV